MPDAEEQSANQTFQALEAASKYNDELNFDNAVIFRWRGELKTVPQGSAVIGFSCQLPANNVAVIAGAGAGEVEKIKDTNTGIILCAASYMLTQEQVPSDYYEEGYYTRTVRTDYESAVYFSGKKDKATTMHGSLSFAEDCNITDVNGDYVILNGTRV